MTLIEFELGVIALCLLQIASRPIRPSPPSLWQIERTLARIQEALTTLALVRGGGSVQPYVTHSTGVYNAGSSNGPWVYVPTGEGPKL